jgi:hypothetical protein
MNVLLHRNSKRTAKICFITTTKKRGEVDFLIDDYDTLSVLPLEVKSGKDYSTHRALNNFVTGNDYPIQNAYVLSNEREVFVKNKITYLPVYDVMFL